MIELHKAITGFFGIDNKEDLCQMESLFTSSFLKKGAILAQNGQICDKLIFVMSGYIRLFANQDGKEITQWISSPGNFTTDMAGFLFHTPSRFTIQAITDTEVFVIHKSDYKKLLK